MKKNESNAKSTVGAYRNEGRVLEPKREQNTVTASKKEKQPNGEEIKLYKSRINDLEVKLEMIAEIAKSSENSEQKMKLIEEVLEIKTTQVAQ